MESISFEEEPVYTSASTPAKRKTPFLTSLVISTGLAKTNKEADRILIIVAVIGFIITAYFSYVVIVPPHSIIPQSILDANNAKLFKGRP